MPLSPAVGRLLLMAMMLAMAASSVATAAATPPAAAPSSRLSPAQAVRIQLDGLARNDLPAPDAGIARVWRFASPGNRQQTGPYPRFAKMVHDAYPEMLGHRQATLAPTVFQDGQALQGVELLDRGGTLHRYIFILSQVDTPTCRRCWLTDGVIAQPETSSTNSI